MKLLVSRPLIKGGSGYSKVPDGELVYICNNKLMGVITPKVTTAIRVEEIEREKAEELIMAAILAPFKITCLSEDTLRREATLQLATLNFYAGLYPVGTKLFVDDDFKIRELIK